VTDGIDRCLVGCLPRHCVPYHEYYEGRVAQIVKFLKESEEPADHTECAVFTMALSYRTHKEVSTVLLSICISSLGGGGSKYENRSDITITKGI
jgi:hypothetical protein